MRGISENIVGNKGNDEEEESDIIPCTGDLLWKGQVAVKMEFVLDPQIRGFAHGADGNNFHQRSADPKHGKDQPFHQMGSIQTLQEKTDGKHEEGENKESQPGVKTDSGVLRRGDR